MRMTSGIFIDSGNSTVALNTELKGGNLIRIAIKLKKSMFLSKGTWPLIPPNKRPNVFSILKTHKKTFVSFIPIRIKIGIKKPISQVNFSDKILKGFGFTMPSLFFFVKFFLLAICGR